MVIGYSDIRGNPRANACVKTRLSGSVVFISYRINPRRGYWAIRSKYAKRMTRVGAALFKLLTYQLWAVGYWPTVAFTGNGELGFGSGEEARETATTSKEGSRRANYSILTQGGSDEK